MNNLLFGFMKFPLNIISAQFQGINDSGMWEIFKNPTIIAMTTVALVLLLAIFLLGNAMIKIKYMVLQDKKKKLRTHPTDVVKSFIPFIFIGEGSFGFNFSYGLISENIIDGVHNSVFYLLLMTIFIELVVILFIIRTISVDVKPYILSSSKPLKTRKKVSFYDWWWKKVNKASDDEDKVDTGHMYDGIRELDNKIPPWWRYAFYSTIVFAVVYLWRYHVSETAPLQIEEYEIAVAEAEEAHQAYLLAAGNRIDENNVEMVDEDGIQAGEKIFMQNCAACHGGNGEGLVGPNLTDEYWIHGKGELPDVFTVVKYGVVEKGMMAWKDQLSPSMMAQVSSYILTLQGTNPPNQKEPQGERYEPAN